MKTFDFSDALLWITVREKRASLTINGTERTYYKQDNTIRCIPNGLKHLSYPVRKFHIDAVLSEEWILLD